MLRGFPQLVWLELKIFLREPLGAIGTIVLPVLVFLIFGKAAGPRVGAPSSDGLLQVPVPVLAAVLISISAVLSLVTIIAVYREGGILRRLRATPLRPQTILSAHVAVKLLLTALTLVAVMLAGRRMAPIAEGVPLAGFLLALLISTLSILSIGFVIASIVPTARFAQPVGAAFLYPMIALSGIFVPVEALPPALNLLARCMPLTYSVSLLTGIWNGERWVAHLGDLAALGLIFALCTGLSARVFRWE
jgi:ABC-2 type transport system permease protein